MPYADGSCPIQPQSLTGAEQANVYRRRSPRAGAPWLFKAQARRSEAELGSGVVLPGLVDPYVGPKSGKGAVTSLVGDRSIRRSPQVGIGDEAGTEAVCAVAGGIEAGSCYRSLNQLVDRFGVERSSGGVIALAHASKYRPVADPRQFQPFLKGL